MLRVGGFVVLGVLKRNEMTQTKRIRFGVKFMQSMQKEIDIRNQVIEQLQADLAIYLSEKSRLGETNAWLTEQNDALSKEVIAANQSHEVQHQTLLQYQQMYEHLKKQAGNLFAENTSLSVNLDLIKAVAIIAIIANLVLGAILIWG